MLASRLVFRAGVLAVLVSLIPASGLAAGEQRKKAAKAPSKPPQATQKLVVGVQDEPTPPAAPAPPPAPLTLAQKPAVPPQVEYHNGQLSIIAENSTLGDVLRAVRQKTGTAIEIPGNATERVVMRLGPAPLHDVLVSLLDGSSFNYVMVGSPADPNAVTKVVLTAKPAGMEVASAAGPGQPPAPQSPPVPFRQRNAATENTAPEAQADMDANDDADDQPAGGDAQQPSDEQPPDQNAQPGAPGVIKTPQQMLEELQRQQQIQQQLQQQQQSIPGSSPIGQPPQPPPQQEQ